MLKNSLSAGDSPSGPQPIRRRTVDASAVSGIQWESLDRNIAAPACAIELDPQFSSFEDVAVLIAKDRQKQLGLKRRLLGPQSMSKNTAAGELAPFSRTSFHHVSTGPDSHVIRPKFDDSAWAMITRPAGSTATQLPWSAISTPRSARKPGLACHATSASRQEARRKPAHRRRYRRTAARSIRRAGRRAGRSDALRRRPRALPRSTGRSRRAPASVRNRAGPRGCRRSTRRYRSARARRTRRSSIIAATGALARRAGAAAFDHLGSGCPPSAAARGRDPGPCDIRG